MSRAPKALLLVFASALVLGCPMGQSEVCGHRLEIHLQFASAYPDAGAEFHIVDGANDGVVRDCIPGSGDDFEASCASMLESPGLIYGYSDERGDMLPDSIGFSVLELDGGTLLETTFAPSFALETDGVDPLCSVARETLVVPATGS